ncbi:MAG: hypothetical protein B6242_14985 [Anaerolineaceae bacterium 4572_78]|nr:MAG: hypothetical protein B6242_14985 [Anaerolineaceae bacterium 4572_78]
MLEQTITITLPNTVYDRIRETATITTMSFESVLRQFLKHALPKLEDDLPPDARAMLLKLPLHSNDALWKIARCSFDEDKQIEIELLAELQKHQDLTHDEQTKLNQLMHEAQSFMLYKAEACRLLAWRGYPVFSSPTTIYHERT